MTNNTDDIDTIPEGPQDCNVCNGLIKTVDRDIGRSMAELGVEKIDGIVTYAVAPIIEYPHVCSLDMLKAVEYYYLHSHITAELFDHWMAINGGDYQLGRGGMLQYLWDDRLLACKEVDFILNYKFESDTIKGTDVSIVRCKVNGHAMHAQIKNPNKQQSRLKHLKVLNSLFPWPARTDEEHSNIKLASLVDEMCVAGLGKVVNEALALVPVGTFNSIACSMLIHLGGNAHCGKLVALIRKDKACCMGPNAYRKYFKGISTALRRNSSWEDETPASLEEVTACTYWELPIGRSNMLGDLDAELQHRTVDYLPLKMPCDALGSVETDSNWWDYASPCVKQVMEQLIPHSMKWPTWLDHCRNRQAWLPSGSAGAKFVYIGEEKVRVNKRTYMEGVPINEMAAWLDIEPRMPGGVSFKYEMGKERVIYPTGVEDQCIFSYVIGPLERNFPRVDGLESGLTGIDEIRTVLRRINVMKGGDKECSCLDYADFNIQHTLQAQYELFKGVEARLKHIDAEPDVIKACCWAADSLLNQWCTFPHRREPYKITQGMFSGVRATHFINTLLNLIYFKTANLWVANTLKLRPIELFNIHQGDDVWITNQSRLWAIALYHTMKAMNFVFQKSKQIMDRNTAEYLRVVYTREGARGYLARTIATILEKPLQGDLDISPATKASALNSQIAICYRRGLGRKMAKVLWDVAVMYALKCSIVNEKGARICFTIPKSLANRAFPDGGLDLGPPMTMAKKAIKVAPLPAIVLRSSGLEQAAGTHTTDAYISVMSEALATRFNADKVRDQLHRANVSDSIPQHDKIKALRSHQKDLTLWLEKFNRNPHCHDIQRNYENMDEWLAKEVQGEIGREFLDRLTSLWQLKKDNQRPQYKLQTIMRAVSASPFKDIATAMQALGVGTIEAARMAIRACQVDKLRTDAAGLLREMEECLGPDITSRALDGIRGYGPAVESLLHPTILSVLNAYGVDKTVAEAKAMHLNKADDWDELLMHNQSSLILRAVHTTVLPAISHY